MESISELKTISFLINKTNMGNTNVFFTFKTKEQWIAFGEKFFSEMEFTKNSHITKKLTHMNKPFNEWVQVMYDYNIPETIGAFSFVQLQSENTMRLLNDWIKENHYDKNYFLRDNHGDRINMDLDTLLECWSDNKNKSMETQTKTLEQLQSEYEETIRMVMEFKKKRESNPNNSEELDNDIQNGYDILENLSREIVYLENKFK